MLLVALPLSVFVSMRWFGFSVVAAAIAAAASTLLSGDFRYGFDYDSYIWRGFGMTTQLFAMHLSFLTVAAAYRAIHRGKGVWIAALLLGLLVLTHLIYAYMSAMAIAIIMIWGLVAKQRPGPVPADRDHRWIRGRHQRRTCGCRF